VTPADLRSAREEMGLTQTQLAEALRLGRMTKKTVQRWESFLVNIPGPVQVAVELLLRDHRRRVKRRSKVKRPTKDH
jgi:transcriptional regulator with XRE-family HTH domain